MGLLIKRAIVGLVAIVSSVWSVTEVSLFAFDAFAAEEDEQGKRDEAFQQLSLFADEIQLRAGRVMLMEDGPARETARTNVGEAMEKWATARDKWLAGEYYNMTKVQEEAKARLYGENYAAPADEGEPWLDDVVRSPAFPYATVGLAALLAMLAWALFMGWRHHRGESATGPTEHPGPPGSPPHPPHD